MGAARDLARIADPSEDRLAMFMRGLVVGSFVGAAIAGSTIWRGVRARRAREGRASR